ncbi:D-aminoacyl-tRNA deacylase [Anaerocolumna sp. AGMB13025]|uniref:D-aminoacyl-tRNA deacylase n=1 Tax=Anaerocolumna sp. AGMB13025 TaxID=3039116 RepID=UPI00241C2CEC|nr:D-aminoacyl-tRNA deacylase [Anaerocolumna sp. AGMB13025]WFR57760.1 D-aminoacyl-tRNA deacylase [Anaerocolumna sp. AGMB13025]
MKIVIQRVKQASVTVEGVCVGKIGEGLLLFIGIGREDTMAIADKYIEKILKLRIFSDEQGKTNLSLLDINGEILAISQFTLYADCKKGNRPNFLQAADPQKAQELYRYFLDGIKNKLGKVEAGEFGADMKVELLNDGPFTVVLEDHELGIC